VGVRKLIHLVCRCSQYEVKGSGRRLLRNFWWSIAEFNRSGIYILGEPRGLLVFWEPIEEWELNCEASARACKRGLLRSCLIAIEHEPWSELLKLTV
jgi:hypothetical protein